MRILLTLTIISMFSGVCAAQTPPGKYDLIVFIAVDQMRPDYLDRWAAQLTGGLARLRNGGAVFTNAFQDHAVTDTGPGHSEMLSGRFPRSTGILTNDYGTKDRATPLIGFGSNDDAVSPFRFRGTVLMDWMRAQDPDSRGLSVSRKDRAAMLPMGRAKQNVFWYYKGKFTTSRYYADTLPTWINRINSRRVPESYAGRAWTPLLPANAYNEKDSAVYEGDDWPETTFPHVMVRDPKNIGDEFREYPWMDELTLQVAWSGLRQLQLGKKGHTDLLSVSLSSTDAIGHRFGPNSMEIHDQIIRLDRYLGWFLDSLYARYDSTRVIIALTADHGIGPFPAERGTSRVSFTELVASIRASFARANITRDTFDFRFEEGVLFVNRDALGQRGVNVDSLVNYFAAELRKINGIARIDTPRNLLTQDTVNDAISRRWLHSIAPDQPVELVVTLKPGYMWRPIKEDSHGQPYDYDANVPIIFYGPPFKQGRYPEAVRVVDIAPTLAFVAGFKPTERLDGMVLTRILKW